MKKIILLISSCILFLSNSCTDLVSTELRQVYSSNVVSKPFSIYKVKTFKMISNKCAIDTKSVILESTPLIGQNEIVSYNDKDFVYTLTNAASYKIKKLKDNTPVAICLGKKIVFLSIFKPLTSSSTCQQSITFHYLKNNEIKFQLGYPKPSGGIFIDDQRNQKALIETLKSAGKLNARFLCVTIPNERSLLVSEVKSKIYGEWKLESKINTTSNSDIQNIKIVFKDVLGAPIDKQLADVYLDCKLSYSTLYSLKQIDGVIKTVQMIPDKNEYTVNQPSILVGKIRICDGELMIQNSTAAVPNGNLFSKQNNSRCLLKPDGGMCLAVFERYYYDPIEKRCKSFNWGGCEGTVPFETLEACKSCECKK